MVAAAGLVPAFLTRSAMAMAAKPASVALRPEIRAVPRKEGSC
ncbi:hypothetical protein [Opitutus sp. GAS368]|nr:hypothetical protein [Opitutus sp. GAS368]